MDTKGSQADRLHTVSSIQTPVPDHQDVQLRFSGIWIASGESVSQWHLLTAEVPNHSQQAFHFLQNEVTNSVA